MKIQYVLVSLAMATLQTSVVHGVTAEIDHLLAEPNLFHFEPLVHFDDLGHFDIPNLNYAKDSVAAKVSPQLASKNAKRRRIGNTVERTMKKQHLLPILNKKPAPVAVNQLAVGNIVPNSKDTTNPLVLAEIDKAKAIYQSTKNLLISVQSLILHRQATASELNEMENALVQELDAMLHGEHDFEGLLHASEQRIKVLNKVANRKLDPIEQYQLAHALKGEMEARKNLQSITDDHSLSAINSDFELSSEEANFLNEIFSEDGSDSGIPDLEINWEETDLKRKLKSKNSGQSKIAKTTESKDSTISAKASSENFESSFVLHDAAWKRLYEVQAKLVGHRITLPESNELRNAVVEELETKASQRANAIKKRDNVFLKFAKRKLNARDLEELRSATREELEAWNNLMSSKFDLNKSN